MAGVALGSSDIEEAVEGALEDILASIRFDYAAIKTSYAILEVYRKQTYTKVSRDAAAAAAAAAAGIFDHVQIGRRRDKLRAMELYDASFRLKLKIVRRRRIL